MSSRFSWIKQGRARDLASILLLALMIATAVAITARAIRPTRTQVIDTQLASGNHITFVLIGPTSTGNRSYVEMVRAAKAAVRDYADGFEYFYSTVGISDAWQPDYGLELLGEFGPFDEVIVGRNWLNTGVATYITDLQALAGVPQVLVTRQYIRVDTIPFQYGELEELVRVVGFARMAEWSKAGFPIPRDAAFHQPTTE